MTGQVESLGCSLCWTERGAGDAVVFIQGVGIHGDGWRPQTDSLSEQFRCVSFDNRGMGRSQPVAVKLSVEQMANDTLTVMDAAGVDKAHLVGHSLGGVVAQQMALTARDRVRSLALLCTSARGADATAPSWRMIALGMRTRVGPRRARARAFLQIVMPGEYLAAQDRDALADRLEPLFGHHLGDSPPISMPQLNALRQFDATARLRELAGLPTLVLSAAQDIIFPPRCGRTLAAGIPGARYVEMGQAAHGAPLQDPDFVNQQLREHLARA